MRSRISERQKWVKEGVVEGEVDEGWRGSDRRKSSI